jgi:GH18 family chitinase
MKKLAVFILAIAVLSSMTYGAAARKYLGWSTGYHTNWDGKSPSQLNYKPYTHLCWFSGSINAPSQSEGQSFTSTCHANNTKAILCLGGAGAGGSFTSNTTNSNRGAFISRSLKSMVAQGFDGIDLDWEDGINNTQYTALHKELRDSMNKMTPRPLLTVATAGYLSGNTATVMGVFDQINVMSYWSLIGNMQNEMNTFTSKGFPKNKLGIGWGFDNDGEVDINNPNDIGAKCLFAINGGYGGGMIWEIALACKKCEDTNIYYVCKTCPSTEVQQFASPAQQQRTSYATLNSTSNGANQVSFSLASPAVVDLKLFNMQGMVVQSLLHGARDAGTYTVALSKNGARMVTPGVYVAKLVAPGMSSSGTVLVK